MKKYLVFGISLFASVSFSEVKALRFFIEKENKYITVSTVQIQGFTVNDQCKKKGCTALKIATGKPQKIKEHGGPTFYNPGSSYCWDVGAKARVLKDAKNNEYDFCVLEDGSMIDAWDLYSKHYPSTRIK